MAENEWFDEDNLIYIRNREQMMLGDYKKAKELLELDKSEESYKDMIKACYWIALDWKQVRERDDFQGVMQEYEKTVLEYWKQYQTTESLCQALYFYSDPDIVSCMEDMAGEHMKKGIPYAELYHEREDKDYSACIHVDIYLKLYWLFGEVDEQLGYLEKAWSLVREYAKKYRTLQMLEKYQETVEALVIYRGFCPQDIDEETVAEREREFEEFSAAVEGTMVSDAKKRQEEMFCNRGKACIQVEELRCRVLPHSREVMAGHRREVVQCARVCLKLQRIAHYQGLEPLLRAGDKLAEGRMLYQQMLAYGILLICRIMYEPVEMAEKMLERFSSRGDGKEDMYKGFMLYLCISLLGMIQRGEGAQIIKRFLLSMLPAEERGGLLKYLEFETV